MTTTDKERAIAAIRGAVAGNVEGEETFSLGYKVFRAIESADLRVVDRARLREVERRAGGEYEVQEPASPVEEDAASRPHPRYSAKGEPWPEPRTANVAGAFDSFIGQRLVAVMHNAQRGGEPVTRLLRFESGFGLEISASNGSFWPVSVEDTAKRFEKRRAELEAQLRSVAGQLSR